MSTHQRWLTARHARARLMQQSLLERRQGPRAHTPPARTPAAPSAGRTRARGAVAVSLQRSGRLAVVGRRGALRAGRVRAPAARLAGVPGRRPCAGTGLPAFAARGSVRAGRLRRRPCPGARHAPASVPRMGAARRGRLGPVGYSRWRRAARAVPVRVARWPAAAAAGVSSRRCGGVWCSLRGGASGRLWAGALAGAIRRGRRLLGPCEAARRGLGGPGLCISPCFGSCPRRVVQGAVARRARARAHARAAVARAAPRRVRIAGRAIRRRGARRAASAARVRLRRRAVRRCRKAGTRAGPCSVIPVWSGLRERGGVQSGFRSRALGAGRRPHACTRVARGVVRGLGRAPRGLAQVQVIPGVPATLRLTHRHPSRLLRRLAPCSACLAARARRLVGRRAASRRAGPFGRTRGRPGGTSLRARARAGLGRRLCGPSAAAVC